MRGWLFEQIRLHVMLVLLVALLEGCRHVHAKPMKRPVLAGAQDANGTASVRHYTERCVLCDFSTVSVPPDAPELNLATRVNVLEQYWHWLRDVAGVSQVCGWHVGRVRQNIATLAQRLQRVFVLVEGDSFARNAFFAIILQAVHPHEDTFQWSRHTYHQPHVICCGNQDADGYLVDCALEISPTPADTPGLVTQYFDAGKRICVAWLWDHNMNNYLSPWRDACMLPHVYVKNGGLHLDDPPAEYRERFSKWADNVLSVNAEIADDKAQMLLHARDEMAPAACRARAEPVQTYFMGTTHNPYHEWSVEQQYNSVASSVIAAQACPARSTCISFLDLAALAGIDGTGQPRVFHTLNNGTDIHYSRSFYMWVVEPILHSAVHSMPLC